MRVYSFQEKSLHKTKTEMEDRLVINQNISADGFHYVDNVENGLFAVMDGVGGLTGSAHASSSVAKSLSSLPKPVSINDIIEIIHDVHTELCTYSKTATTATGVLFDGKTCHLFHVGNTRLYALVEGYIRQLTVDHTESMRLLNLGMNEDAIPDKSYSTLIACVGAGLDMIKQFTTRDISTTIRNAQRLMLCSDGIHDFVSDDDLEVFLTSEINYNALDALKNQARSHGSEDDISIIVVEL